MAAPLDIDKMRDGAAAATGLLRILANEDRLMLLCQLTHGEHSVSELEELLEIPQPTLSQQLGVLRKEAIVATRRDGKRIYYQVSEPRVRQLLGVLYTLFCAPARRATSQKRISRAAES